MKRYIYLLVILLVAQTLSSCRDDEFLINGNEYQEIEGLPVDLEIVMSDALLTRGDIYEDSKKKFETNELVHISAVYTCENIKKPGETYQETQYGVYKYGGRNSWTAMNNALALAWPPTAISADFTAYYIYGSTGELTAQTMDPILLSEYEYDKVPLCAHANNIEYGHTIRLEMSHIFSFFTITDLSSGITDELFFTIPQDNPDYATLNNAFSIEYDPENHEIREVFSRVPSDVYKDGSDNGLVFIEGHGDLYENNDGTVMTKVSYFLEPGVYRKFSLMYPRTRDEAATYFIYDRDLTQIVGDEGFVANGVYEFSVLKSLGVTIIQEPNDGWDDTSEPWVLADVEAFLKAANSGSAYSEYDEETEQDVQILESTVEGTRLVRNVDFQYFYYDKFAPKNGVPEFTPDLTNTFEGNYHYIFHTACPLFANNNGIIKNLGLRDVKTQSPLVSNENFTTSWGGNMDTSYNGAIARVNYGTISNMRVINVDMEIYIQTSDPEEPTQEAHNSSLLVGSNRSNIFDIRTAGTFKLKVMNAPDETIMPQVITGGVAGQNLGTISRIAPIDDEDFSDSKYIPSYTLYNECVGENGVYMIGGVAGNNTGNIYDIQMSNITVDATSSQGVEARIGGLIGNIAVSNANPAQISGCTVRGSVKAGVTKPITNNNGLSYTGGLAGSSNIQVYVSNCSASFSVAGAPTSSYNSLITYGTGGAFGRIEKTLGAIEGSIQTLAAFGSSLSGLVYVGNFAGIVPTGYDWSHWQNLGVTVKQNQGVNNIGTEM